MFSVGDDAQNGYTFNNTHNEEHTMLHMILVKTPVYVWAILAFLVYRGMLASRTRELTLRSACIMPIVLTALSAQGVFGSFGLNAGAVLCWLAGLLLSAWLAARSLGAAQVAPVPGTNRLQYRGSWMPMLLMLLIFVAKYVINVMLAIDAAWAQNAMFVIVVSLACGGMSGALVGKMLKSIQIYQQSHSTAGLQSA